MFNEELKKLDVSVKSFSDFDKDKEIKRIHKDNMFNTEHSFIMSSFDEINTLSLRLGNNIESWVAQEGNVQKMPEWINHKSGYYPDIVQVEMKKGDQFGKEVEVDFKALYIFSKILLDKYVKFIYFINPVDGIRSGTVESFLNSLEKTQNSFYKKLYQVLGQNSKDVINKLNFYRDKKIEHRQILDEDTWFINGMNGNITISHVDRKDSSETKTIQPVELLRITGTFFEITSNFLKENKDEIPK